MIGTEPAIPLTDISNFPVKVQKQMKASSIKDLVQLFVVDNSLLDAIKLANLTDLSIRETLEARQLGRRHMEKILADITAKRKVEPLDLLWKIHWLLGSVPEGTHRQELIALEASALTTLLENLKTAKAPVIEKLLQILLHRLLIIPNTTLKAEIKQLVDFAEKVQRQSLLAYHITKAKATFLTLGEEQDPAKRIVELRKVTKIWKNLFQIMEQRSEEQGKMILTALQAVDRLAVLDISEQHLKERIQQSMSTKKLRQSQLTHITAAMNAAIEFQDAYLISKLATRASKIWFELAQGKPSKEFGDDLLRSLRFARTAIFHFRALDDLSGTVQQLEYLIHLIGEIPTDSVEILDEALNGVLKTFVSTAPLLDRPADQKFILRTTKRIDTLNTRLLQQLTNRETRYKVVKLHIKFQQSAIKQLKQLGAKAATYQELNRQLIRALLRLADTTSEEGEKEILLNNAAKYAKDLIPDTQPLIKIDEQDLEIISEVASQLTQQPRDTLSDLAQYIIDQSHQLNEQLYFKTKDPQLRAQLAVQLLLSKLVPDSSGRLLAAPQSKELDKLEEYASTALLAQVKAKQYIQGLKAGSILVWIMLQRLRDIKDIEEIQKLKRDARDFAEKTITFMPPSSELTGEAYPFAFLLLRNINELVHDERPVDESQWEELLTQSEQLAQKLAKVATSREDISNQILALSAAGAATAKLATITPDKTQQSRLLKRATTQIQKALHAAAIEGSPRDIEAALSQYNQIMRTRLTITVVRSAQISIFEEWNQTYDEAIKALQKANASDVANRLQAYRLLNAQVPLTFALLSKKEESMDSIRRKLTELLQEANEIGSPEQARLAKQLERRWAFQLGEDSLLASGYRLEDAETSFTLADEQFRINLQIEPQITINGQIANKIQSFPFLRPSTHPQGIVWYDETPILCSIYEHEKIYMWLTLQDPTETTVTIGLWLLSSMDLMVNLTLKILATETLSQGPEGVGIQLTGAQVNIRKQPAVAEHHENKGILIYELALTPGFPEALPLQIQIV